MYGSSLGAIVSLSVMNERPDLVKTVTLADPPLFWNEFIEGSKSTDFKAFREYREICKSLKDENTSENYERLKSLQCNVERLMDTTYTFLLSLKRADPGIFDFIEDPSKLATNVDLISVLKNFDKPKLLLQADSEYGSVLPANILERIGSINNLYHVFLKGFGHGPHFDNPERVADIVRDFTLLFE